MKISEMLVQNGETHDDILHNRSMPVNMRLYDTNDAYRSIVLDTMAHMMSVGSIEFDDYPKTQGISGANVGIPFNIVIVFTKEGRKIFINPEIIERSDEMVTAKSNCGSVNLPEPIEIRRHKWVVVRWYDRVGLKHEDKFEIGDGRPVASATLQHEIEHNLGILVIDKEEG